MGKAGRERPRLAAVSHLASHGPQDLERPRFLRLWGAPRPPPRHSHLLFLSFSLPFTCPSCASPRWPAAATSASVYLAASEYFACKNCPVCNDGEQVAPCIKLECSDVVTKQLRYRVNLVWDSVPLGVSPHPAMLRHGPGALLLSWVLTPPTWRRPQSPQGLQVVAGLPTGGGSGLHGLVDLTEPLLGTPRSRVHYKRAQGERPGVGRGRHALPERGHPGGPGVVPGVFLGSRTRGVYGRTHRPAVGRAQPQASPLPRGVTQNSSPPIT